jgi:hypothetical protein
MGKGKLSFYRVVAGVRGRAQRDNEIARELPNVFFLAES